MRSALERSLLSPAAIRVLAEVAGRPGAPRVSRAVRANPRIVTSLVRRGLLREDGELLALTDEGLRAIRPEDAR